MDARGKTVLFVDDDETVLKSIARGLYDEPYNRCYARSGEQALEILRQQEVHVLVTDMRMPGMNGADLLKIVTKEYPNLVKLVLSGYTDAEDIMKAVHEGRVFRLLRKPWNLQEGEDFKRIVRRAVEQSSLKCQKAGAAAESK